MLKLYTKNGCNPCSSVKYYLETRPDLKVEIINCSDSPERVMEFSDFSKTFPTLVTPWGFVNNSQTIIEHLKQLSGDLITPPVVENLPPTVNSQQENVSNTVITPKTANFSPNLYKEKEPDCEACQ